MMLLRGMTIVVSVLAFIASAQAAQTGPRQGEGASTCPLGEVRPLDPRLEDEPYTEPFVINCVALRHSGTREVTAWRTGLHLENVCVEITFTWGSSGDCRGDLDSLHGLAMGFSFGPAEGRWVYFGGLISPRVARVRLRYFSHRTLRRPKAIVTRISDPAALAKLGLKRS